MASEASNELGVDNLTPVKLCCDNQSAIHMGKNSVQHERTKYIELDVHFTRDKVLEGLLELSYIPTGDQLADLFTKTLPSPQLSKLMSNLGVFTAVPAPSLRGVLKYLLLSHQLLQLSISFC